MPVSESEKLGVSVLGCHFSEKAEHIPIKKRRFLFRASSPPRNTTNQSSGGTERNTTSLKDSNHGVQLNPHVTGLSASSEAISDDKAIKDEDFSGISILAAAACSNSLGVEADQCEGSGLILSGTKSLEAPINTEFKENDVKPANICIEESDSHTKNDLSTGKFTLDKSSSPDESTLDNSNSSSQAPLESAVSKTNQEASMIEKSSARDVRLNWDLNTVMDTWEEPFGAEHEHDNVTSVQERENDDTKGSSVDCKLGIKRVSESASIVNNLVLPVELKSSAHENKQLKLGKCEPDSYAEINDSASHAVIDETESLHTKRIDGANDAILVTTTHDIFTKWSTEAVDTELSMDCSVPPGFDHCLRTSKENVGVGNKKFPIFTTQTVSTINSRSEYDKHDLSLRTATFLVNGPHQSVVTSVKDEDEDKSRVKMEDLVSKGTDIDISHEFGDQPVTRSSMHDAEAPLDNGFGCDNSQSDNKAGSGIEKLDEISIGYDSQYEDGELRESSMQIENEANLDVGINNVHEASSQCEEQEGSSRIKPTEPDVPSSVLLPEKLHNSDEANEIVTDQEDGKRQDVVKEAGQSDEWKMNVSGWDLLPENHRNSSNNFTKPRNFSGRKFSYREQKDGFEPDDAEMKGEGSRFYRKESLTRIGGPSTRDTFVSNRGRFRMQGCSSKAADDLPSRPERVSGPLRSFGRGRYSPPNRASGRGGATWNRSPERGRDLKRLPSPSYQAPPFFRSMLDDVGPTDNTETNMDPSDINRPNNSSYITHRTFRSRSPMNREENDFRARLGLRPNDTCHERFTGRGGARGRGRTVRYGGPGPRSRYHGLASDECDELLPEYSNFPRRRRCFSPIERRTNQNQNHSYVHHRSDSRSPSNPVFRRRSSRSPPSNFRSDTRIRRPRSPNYRRAFEDHVNEYNNNPGPRSNTSPPPRWVNYKERERDRFDFYDSARKPKQNEYYRSGHPGRFTDRPRYNNDGYRRGGFVRKRFQYEEEQDGFDLGYDARDKQALEFHARTNTNTNTKVYSNGTTTDSRFRDFPRRMRDDRDAAADGGFKRRKDVNEESEHVTDDSSQRRSTTNLDSTTPSEVAKEGDKDKPMLGSN